MPKYLHSECNEDNFELTNEGVFDIRRIWIALQGERVLRAVRTSEYGSNAHVQSMLKCQEPCQKWLKMF